MPDETRNEGIVIDAPASRDRGTETREQEMRDTPWKPAPLLPQPNPREGLEFRWVRASTRGEADNINVSQALREGWVPILSTDYPELQVVSDRGSQYPDNVLVGGLLLCARPTEIGDQVRRHAEKEAQGQMDAVDHNYFREQDPRMPMLRPERNTRITFGDN
tara:strand:- start:17 stop:502 length:486 start_codon:yes stop_codon:yes gene_type:complete